MSQSLFRSPQRFGLLLFALLVLTFPATQPAFAFEVPNLPPDNLIENPWFRSASNPSRPGLDGWTDTGGINSTWSSSQKESNPGPDLLVSGTCGLAQTYCGTSARLSLTKGQTGGIGQPGEDAYLYQVVSADRDHRKLKFFTHWVSHRIDPAEITVYGGDSNSGPWEAVWVPFSHTQFSNPRPPAGGAAALWTSTGFVETRLDQGFDFYKIEIHARLPEGEGAVGFKITGVYFATEAIDTSSVGSVIGPAQPISPATPSLESDPGLSTRGSGGPESQSAGITAYQVDPDSLDWPMAGANPQRTSAISAGVGGMLSAEWIKPFEPYISQKVQIIASEGRLFVSTAAGLYALDAKTGQELWLYPTAMPLGHSPTVADGVVYVGGFDRKIHAVDIQTGLGLWTFTAGGGFSTNPLVVDGMVFAGSRDGNLYALDAGSGELRWKFQTDGPILFSAAYRDGTVYIVSNDRHAYAFEASLGSLTWRSDPLPGLGFHSWWPVVFDDYLIIPASSAYDGKMHSAERNVLYPAWESDPDGTLIGPLVPNPGLGPPGMPVIDVTRTNASGDSLSITDYLEQFPSRRTMIVLNRSDGQEVTFDLDEDGRVDYLPALWSGTTGSGTRYPPAIGPDGLIYFRNNTMSDGAIPGGGLTGWQFGTPYLTLPQSREIGGNGDWPVDEPSAYAIGGQILYHILCCDRVIGAVDLSIANPFPPPAVVTADRSNDRQWRYEDWQLRGYNQELDKFLWNPDQSAANELLFFAHGDQNPPVPYDGLVFAHRSNTLIALAPGGSGRLLPTAQMPEQMPDSIARGPQDLQIQLIGEVQKILDAGHLRPGYSDVGLHNHFLEQMQPFVLDYFADPADTMYTLLRALPYLPDELQAGTRDYLQAEFRAYPPQNMNHAGWQEGQPRDPFPLPEIGRGGLPGRGRGGNPESLYALWKYAESFGGAEEIFNQVRNRLGNPPEDEFLAWNPQVHNAYIAAYLGYLNLERLSGLPETQPVREELNRLLALRADTFTADLRHPDARRLNGRYYYTLIISWNFMDMVPELAEYLKEHAQPAVAAAVARYEAMAPYWFAAKAEEVQGEGTLAPLYHYHGLFQAKAKILDEDFQDLEKYLDIPAFTTGDLFYIDNLISALEAVPDSELLENPPTAELRPTQVEITAEPAQTPAGEDPRPRRTPTGIPTITPAETAGSSPDQESSLLVLSLGAVVLVLAGGMTFFLLKKRGP